METHPPHLHQPPKKKLSHHFYEFFMLFLAVFCGFLAENKREHYIEHKRECQYITSLVRDLKKDTAALHGIIQRNLFKKANYDSLFTLLKQPVASKDINRLYYYFIPTTYYQPFHAAKGTIRQLETGGLRLIRNQQAVDSITAYYSMVEKTEGQLNTFSRYFDQYHADAFRIFDYAQIDTLFYDRSKVLNSQLHFTLLTNDPVTIKVLFNKLYALWFITDSYINYLQENERLATSTMAFLQREYHLEKEE